MLKIAVKTEKVVIEEKEKGYLTSEVEYLIRSAQMIKGFLDEAKKNDKSNA